MAEKRKEKKRKKRVPCGIYPERVWRIKVAEYGNCKELHIVRIAFSWTRANH